MGYSTNPETLRKIAGHLDAILSGETVGWTLEDRGQAKLWAYRIREALNIAKMYPASFPQYSTMHSDYRVVVKDNAVFVEPTMSKQEMQPQAISSRNKQQFRAQSQPQPTVSSITGEIIQHGPVLAPYHYKKTGFGPEELLALYDWCQKNQWIMFVVLGDITLRPYDPDYEGIYWTPEDLEPPPPETL